MAGVAKLLVFEPAVSGDLSYGARFFFFLSFFFFLPASTTQALELLFLYKQTGLVLLHWPSISFGQHVMLGSGYLLRRGGGFFCFFFVSRHGRSGLRQLENICRKLAACGLTTLSCSGRLGTVGWLQHGGSLSGWCIFPSYSALWPLYGRNRIWHSELPVIRLRFGTPRQHLPPTRGAFSLHSCQSDMLRSHRAVLPYYAVVCNRETFCIFSTPVHSRFVA